MRTKPIKPGNFLEERTVERFVLPPGYRWLSVGERIRAGELYVANDFDGQVFVTRAPGEKVDKPYKYFRRVLVPRLNSRGLRSGYRWVRCGEVIPLDAGYIRASDGSWRNSAMGGSLCTSSKLYQTKKPKI